MAFNATHRRNDSLVVITMEGDLDASTVPIFKQQIDQAVGPEVRRLVLDMRQLSYLSSAGLRQLIYARQKMDDGVSVELVGPNDRVTQTIKLVGFDQSVTFTDQVPE